MKHFVVIVGVLALLAMGQAEEEEDDVTTVVPPDEDDDSAPPPPGLIDLYYPLRPPNGPPLRRPGPPGPIGQGPPRRIGPPQFDDVNRNGPGPFGGLFDQQQFSPFDRQQGQQQLGNSQRGPFGFLENQQQLVPFGNSQPQQPLGINFGLSEGQQQSGSFGGRQRQQLQGNSQPLRPFGFSDGQQQFGSFNGRQGQQQQGPPGNSGNRFGPPQSDFSNQYGGFGGSYQGRGVFQQQQQQPFGRYPQLEPVLFDFGSKNNFGRSNSFEGQPAVVPDYDY